MLLVQGLGIACSSVRVHIVSTCFAMHLVSPFMM